MSKKFFTSINGTPTDKSLVAENGWHDMDLKWVVTKDNMEAEVGPLQLARDVELR